MTQDLVGAVDGYSAVQLAALAGITRQRIYQLHARGRAPRAVRVMWPGAKRGRLIFARADADRWLAERYADGPGSLTTYWSEAA